MRDAAGAGHAGGRGGVVVQVRAEPALDFLHGHPFAQVVVEHLVAVDFSEAKIARLWMREVEPADAAEIGRASCRERVLASV